MPVVFVPFVEGLLLEEILDVFSKAFDEIFKLGPKELCVAVDGVGILRLNDGFAAIVGL